MGAHHFRHKLGIMIAVNIEWDPIHILHESLGETERFTVKVVINLVTGRMFQPILALLDQRLTVNSRVMEVEDPCSYTKPTIHRNYLSSAMDWLSHLTH